MNSGAIGTDFGIHTKVYELIDWIKKDHRTDRWSQTVEKPIQPPLTRGHAGWHLKREY